MADSGYSQTFRRHSQHVCFALTCGHQMTGYRERQKILKLHQQGQTQRAIAKAVGVSRGTVQNVLREG